MTIGAQPMPPRRGPQAASHRAQAAETIRPPRMKRLDPSGEPELETEPDRSAAGDRELVVGYLDGSREATAVIDGWIDGALRGSFWSVRAEWEDLRQEVRIRVLDNLRHERFRGDAALHTYVHRIAHHVAIDLCRRAARRPRADSQVGPEVPTAGPNEQERFIARDLLEKVLRGLPEEDRRLIELIHGQHLSYTEVSRLLGIPVGTVKIRMFRCRQRLVDERRRLGASRNR